MNTDQPQEGSRPGILGKRIPHYRQPTVVHFAAKLREFCIVTFECDPTSSYGA
jgi:hypothetical protein